MMHTIHTEEDILDEESLRTALKDLPMGEIIYQESTGSTNDIALELSSGDTPDMSIVTAREQTSGRGRMQRQWVTKPGSSLPMTVLIRPLPEEYAFINLFSPLTGLAAREALRLDYGIEAQIKWPNDVLLKGKKIAGILTETRWEGDRLCALVLGIGTNLRSGAAPKLPNMPYPASSIEEECDIVIPRVRWVRSLMIQLLRLRPLLGTQDFLDLWQESLAYKDEAVNLIAADGISQRYILRGIDREGNLIAEDANGVPRSFIAGEISLRKAD